MKGLLLCIVYLFVLSTVATAAVITLLYPSQFQTIVEDVTRVGLWLGIGSVVIVFILAVIKLFSIFPDDWY